MAYGEIHVDAPAKNTGIIQVTATEPDKEDAAAIVNAVVGAYWRRSSIPISCSEKHA